MGSNSSPIQSGQAQSLPPTPPDWRKPAFDFAADSTKQLITVASGVITATVLFSKDLDAGSRHLALISWVLLIISVFCGLFVLYNMSGQLAQSAKNSTNPDLYERGIVHFSLAQLGFFLVGIIMVIVFGFYARPAEKKPDSQGLNINCVVSPAQIQQTETKGAQPTESPKPSRNSPQEQKK